MVLNHALELGINYIDTADWYVTRVVKASKVRGGKGLLASTTLF